jgi:hypothetical protein
MKMAQIFNSKLTLGEFLKGDLYDLEQSGRFFIPEDKLGHHIVIAGESGKGKTETLLRIAQGAAYCHGWKVFYIDGKGSVGTAKKFLASMFDAGVNKIAYFPDATYNGWKGDARTLYNKLLSVIEYDKRAPFWISMAEMVVGLAINSKAGVPRNSTEFLRLLNQQVLRGLYKGKAQEDNIASLKTDFFTGVYSRYYALFDALKGKLDRGWAFENVDAAYILINGFHLKHEAASLGRFFVEEVSQFLASRKREEDKVLFIIDEYSALKENSAEGACNLATRAREFGAGIILSVQSYAGLGNDKDAEEILDSVNSIILHACSNPEKFIERAGTRPTREIGHQIDRGARTGLGTMRVQEQFKVLPNSVRKFDKGECTFITDGRSANIKVDMIEISEEGKKKVQSDFANKAFSQGIQVNQASINTSQQAGSGGNQNGSTPPDQNGLRNPPVKFNPNNNNTA